MLSKRRETIVGRMEQIVCLLQDLQIVPGHLQMTVVVSIHRFAHSHKIHKNCCTHPQQANDEKAQTKGGLG